jgi:integrase
MNPYPIHSALKDIYNVWELKGRKSILMWAGYLKRIERELKARGHIYCNQLTCSTIREWTVSIIADGTAPGHAKLLGGVLKSALNLAEENGHIERAPRVILPKVERKKVARLTLTDIKRIRTAQKYEVDKDVIDLLWLTGCRVGEALKLRWNHIYKDRIVFRGTKNGDDRHIPLTPSIYKIVQRRWAEREVTEFVQHGKTSWYRRNTICPNFFQRNGRPLDHCSLTQRIRRNLEGTPYERVRFHQFRYSALSWMVMASKLPEAVVRKIAGHKDPRSLERYLIEDLSEVREALEKNEKHMEELDLEEETKATLEKQADWSHGRLAGKFDWLEES